MVRTTVLKNFDYAMHTDRGRVRDRNEDYISYSDTINGHVFVVCDGMGGHNAGDVASELAAESAIVFLNEKYFSNPFDAVENAIVYANRTVYNQALGNDYWHGMGTTVLLLLIRDDRIYYGHAGDSRLYLQRNHVLDQMTEDHSFVQQLLKNGLISRKEALVHPRRHEITKAIGLNLILEPDVSPRTIIPQNDDFIMLCTDGLTNLVSDTDISKILDNPYNLNEKAAKLVSRANKSGGTDNISVILIRFHNLNEQEETQDNKSNSTLMARVRKLLKNRKFSFLLALLFILGTSLLFLRDKEKTIEFTGMEHNVIQTIKKYEVIIPYKQKDGESLLMVSQRFNIDIETIYRLNPNYDVSLQHLHLKIPVKALYVIRQTDDIEMIADIYDLKVSDIMKANSLYTLSLKVGSELIIPLN
jgi:serine/threonine protein phosphatase PrpC